MMWRDEASAEPLAVISPEEVLALNKNMKHK
jgi:hypothetical protein